MAGLTKSSFVVFMVMMMVASTTMAQTRHVVGDSLGWTIPPNGAAAYTTWASQQTFTVGDELYFNFTTGAHNVAEVTQAAYGPCTTTNPISLTTTGPATLTLSVPGNHYYVCTVGTHCQIGQKLTINVVGAATAPTTPPVSPPTATPPPATAPTVSPPTAIPSPAPMTPPTTSPTPTPSPTPSAATPTPAPSPVGASPPSPTTPTGPAPSGSTTPPPASDTTPPPASDTTPTPPSPGSTATRSFAAAVPATLLAFALALFF